jgi:hypothetical protein
VNVCDLAVAHSGASLYSVTVASKFSSRSFSRCAVCSEQAKKLAPQLLDLELGG